MPLTAQQLADPARRTRAYGSELPAILGLSPYTTPADVWLTKVHECDPIPTSEPMDCGTMCEDPMLDWAEHQLGPLIRDQQENESKLHRVHKSGLLGVHLDAMVPRVGAPVDPKTSGLAGPVFGNWGDEGTDQVPEHVQIQMYAQMMCVGCTSESWVPAFIGGRGRIMYRLPWVPGTAEVPACDSIAAMILETCADFMEHVRNGTAPNGRAPSLDILKRIRRTPKTIVPISASVVEAYEAAKAVAKEAKEAKEQAAGKVIEALGDAEAGSLEDGRMVTYMGQRKGGVRSKLLRFDHPDIYAKYENNDMHPKLLIKKAPKKKESV